MVRQFSAPQSSCSWVPATGLCVLALSSEPDILNLVFRTAAACAEPGGRPRTRGSPSTANRGREARRRGRRASRSQPGALGARRLGRRRASVPFLIRTSLRAVAPVRRNAQPRDRNSAARGGVRALRRASGWSELRHQPAPPAPSYMAAAMLFVMPRTSALSARFVRVARVTWLRSTVVWPPRAWVPVKVDLSSWKRT